MLLFDIEDKRGSPWPGQASYLPFFSRIFPPIASSPPISAAKVYNFWIEITSVPVASVSDRWGGEESSTTGAEVAVRVHGHWMNASAGRKCRLKNEREITGMESGERRRK